MDIETFETKGQLYKFFWVTCLELYIAESYNRNLKS